MANELEKPAPHPRPPHEEVGPEEEEGGGPIKSFLEHLEDLRWTLIKAGSSLMVAMVVCLIGAKQLVELMKWPMQKSGIETTLELLEPIGGFMVTLKMAFYAGMVIGLPLILYFVGEFVVPALKRKEKKYFFTAFTIGTGCFLVGVVVCYFYLLPFSLKALVRYNNYLGFATTVWRGEGYFQFATKFLLGVGLLFEIPVLILTLIKLEFITHENLVAGRRYMFIFNLVLCAMLTPADIVTTFMLAMALQLIYEGCILVSGFWARQRRQRLAAEAGLSRARPDHSD